MLCDVDLEYAPGSGPSLGVWKGDVRAEREPKPEVLARTACCDLDLEKVDCGMYSPGPGASARGRVQEFKRRGRWECAGRLGRVGRAMVRGSVCAAHRS